MITNYIQKTIAVLLVPAIAFILGYSFGIGVTYFLSTQVEFLGHDQWFFVPLPRTYLLSPIIFGFLPALLLRKFMNKFLSAALPAVAFTLYELIEVQLYGYLDILSIGFALSFYLLPWSLALFVGLIVWDLPTLDKKTWRKLLALAMAPVVSLTLFWLFTELSCAIGDCHEDGPKLPDSFAVVGFLLFAAFQILIIFSPALLIRKRTDTIAAAAIPSALAAILLMPVVFPSGDDCFTRTALTIVSGFVPWFCSNLIALTIWHRE